MTSNYKFREPFIPSGSVSTYKYNASNSAPTSSSNSTSKRPSTPPPLVDGSFLPPSQESKQTHMYAREYLRWKSANCPSHQYVLDHKKYLKSLSKGMKNKRMKNMESEMDKKKKFEGFQNRQQKLRKVLLSSEDMRSEKTIEKFIKNSKNLNKLYDSTHKESNNPEKKELHFRKTIYSNKNNPLQKESKPTPPQPPLVIDDSDSNEINEEELDLDLEEFDLPEEEENEQLIQFFSTLNISTNEENGEAEDEDNEKENPLEKFLEDWEIKTCLKIIKNKIEKKYRGVESQNFLKDDKKKKKKKNPSSTQQRTKNKKKEEEEFNRLFFARVKRIHSKKSAKEIVRMRKKQMMKDEKEKKLVEKILKEKGIKLKNNGGQEEPKREDERVLNKMKRDSEYVQNLPYLYRCPSI